MRIQISELGSVYEGTPAGIVMQLASEQWCEMQKHEYMRAAARRAKIYSGKPIRPWSADLFLKDLLSAGLIEIIA